MLAAPQATAPQLKGRRCWHRSPQGPVSARAAAGQAPPKEFVGIPPEARKAGGLPMSEAPPQFRAAMEASLRNAFIRTNLACPGLRLQNIDPPVFTIDNFASAELCQALVDAAAASGKMATSQVGGQGLDGPHAAQIRTSTTLAFTKDVLQSSPALKQALEQLLSAACSLCMLDASVVNTRLFTRPQVPGQLVPELPQIARYQPGQHFLAHEDAFPPQAAVQKGYQRRATLLVYLNDVSQGGTTRFNTLGFEVQPQRGKALLFFPSFAGGTPDSRTLHMATDAVDEKWMFQLWLSSALPAPTKPPQQPQKASSGQSKSRRKK